MVAHRRTARGQEAASPPRVARSRGQEVACPACPEPSRCSATVETAALYSRSASPPASGERRIAPARASALPVRSKRVIAGTAVARRRSVPIVAAGVRWVSVWVKANARWGPRRRAIAATVAARRAFAAIVAAGESSAPAPTKAFARRGQSKRQIATNALRKLVKTTAAGRPASSSPARSVNTSKVRIGSTASLATGISARRTASGTLVNPCSWVYSWPMRH